MPPEKHDVFYALAHDKHAPTILNNKKLIFQGTYQITPYEYEIHHKIYLKKQRYLWVNCSFLIYCKGKNGYIIIFLKLGVIK